MTKIRVLVVEDSPTVRARLIEVLRADPEFEVVGEAADGKRAIELCRELRPQVITLDMILPVMSGVAATEYIMAYFPTPILIVSASTNRGELFRTYDALAAGAVDVLDKPPGDDTDADWERRFIAAVKMASRIRVITHPRGRLAPSFRPTPVPHGTATPQNPTGQRRLVAIGASTGGPGAVVDILRALPPGLPAPVLVVVHIGERFGDAFADWLDSQSPHRVTYARDDEQLAPLNGRVVMAPPGSHLVVAGGRLRLTREAERNFCRPSVDVLFESLARECGTRTVACLLTGMGRDGAAGLLEIKHAGGITIAQDEATSVVYGMPREAVRLGAADRVLPLGEIGPWLSRLVGINGGGP